jgi:hypothetical protein
LVGGGRRPDRVHDYDVFGNAPGAWRV